MSLSLVLEIYFGSVSDKLMFISEQPGVVVEMDLDLCNPPGDHPSTQVVTWSSK